MLAARKAFSLIELLVALSVLAIVAAIIVPRFMTVRQQAQDIAATQKLSEINNIKSIFFSMGGRRASWTGNALNPNEAYYMIQFLGTASDGSPQRGFQNAANNPVGAGQPNPLYPTDSTGIMSSATVCTGNTTLGGTDANGKPNAPTTNSADGLYGKQPLAYTGAISGNWTTVLYDKSGSQVETIGTQGNSSDLATAIFIRTGEIVQLK